MTRIDTVITGWIENANILDALNQIEWGDYGIQYCLVSCLDSGRKPAINPRLHELCEGVQGITGLNRSLIMTLEAVLSHTVQSNLFFGFDEVWMFRERPLIDLPDDVFMTSETPITERNNSPRADGIASANKWLKASGCVLGMGDGCGLNYITTERAIAFWRGNHAGG